jgi:hypothetical protein
MDADFLQEYSSLIFEDIHMILSPFLPPVTLTISDLIVKAIPVTGREGS